MIFCAPRPETLLVLVFVLTLMLAGVVHCFAGEESSVNKNPQKWAKTFVSQRNFRYFHSVLFAKKIERPPNHHVLIIVIIVVIIVIVAIVVIIVVFLSSCPSSASSSASSSSSLTSSSSSLHSLTRH